MAEKKDNEEPREVAPKGKKTLLIFAIVAFVLMIAVGAGAYFLGAKSSSSFNDKSTSTKTSVNKPGNAYNKAEKEKLGPMIPIDEFLINLLDKDMNRYLRASMTLEVDNDETLEEIEIRMPQIRDSILLLTSNKTFEELRDLQGKKQLRTELVNDINTLLKKGKIKHIYITNFVIQ